MTELSLTVNGRPHTVQIDPATTLVEVLRDELHLTGTKIDNPTRQAQIETELLAVLGQ